MADAVTSQTLQDADDFAIMRFTNVSDGTGEAGVLKVDVSGLDASNRNGAACNGADIVEIEFNTFGMAVKVLWDADTDVVGAVLQGAGKITFFDRKLVNNAGAGKTGDILFTTVGHTSGDTYDITMKMKKKYAS